MKITERLALAITITLLPLAAAPTFSVSFARDQSPSALDGRLLLLVSTDPSAEPRMQINNSPSTQMIFGMDVDGMQPGEETLLDDRAFGYPVRRLSELKPGHYYIQALLHRYETFHLASGYTVKLPMDRGEGQHWNLAPGNLYSKPQEVTIEASTSSPFRIVMDQKIPPIPEPKDTKYVHHVRIKSELLSKFWGRPMYLGAHILVPEGFDQHPEAHYPLAVFHGHFPDDITGFRTEPPDPIPEAGLQRTISSRRLQQDPAARGLRVLSAMDLAEVSPISGHRDPASHALLRRFLRREFSQRRALR